MLRMRIGPLLIPGRLELLKVLCRDISIICRCDQLHCVPRRALAGTQRRVGVVALPTVPRRVVLLGRSSILFKLRGRAIPAFCKRLQLRKLRFGAIFGLGFHVLHDLLPGSVPAFEQFVQLFAVPGGSVLDAS